MMELVNAVRLLGVKHMLKLRNGYRTGWEDMIRGNMATRIMHTLLNVGYIDELLRATWSDPAVFARNHNLDEHILKSLCETFYCLKIFKRRGTEYALDEKGQLLVDTLRGWFEVSYGYEEVFHRLEGQLRKEVVYARDFYRKSDYVAKGSGEMENWLFFPLANEIILQNKYKRVMDLGCGDGTFLRKLCGLNPDVTCLGIDLAPSAIELGKKRAAEAGLSNRIDLLAADISAIAEQPAEFKGIEAATIFFVLHELRYTSEERVVEFLRAYRKLLPGVPLIAFEAIRPDADEMRERPGISIYYFLYHDLSHQKPLGREEWKPIFRKAGFTNIDERYLDFSRTAIYTVS